MADERETRDLVTELRILAELVIDRVEPALRRLDDPEAPVALDELRQALKTLPEEQREALILVGAGGFAYEEAAEICGCAVGTVKSRVSRARAWLAASCRPAC